MLRVEIRPAARRDIKQIWHYGYENWGARQADDYDLMLGRAIEALAEQPEKGPEVLDLPGIRRWKVKSHNIFYSVEQDRLIVVRVLSPRQLAALHIAS
jgi:toxin ParE1/3/4